MGLNAGGGRKVKVVATCHPATNNMRARVKSKEGEKQEMAERAATSKAGMLSGSL